jgi:O-antigen/teichoic acid export membrane protein
MSGEDAGAKTSHPVSHRRDLASAYLASGAKLGSWVLVSAFVFRCMGRGDFAALALIRGTIGLLNYITLGLAPAMVHEASHAQASPQPVLPGAPESEVLPYFTPDSRIDRLRRIYANGLLVAVLALLVGATLAGVFGAHFGTLFRMPSYVGGRVEDVVYAMALGALFRLVGDVPGAVLQVRGRIVADNYIVAMGEVVWAVSAALFVVNGGELVFVAKAYAASGGLVLALRWFRAGNLAGIYFPKPRLISRTLLRGLLGFGSMVVLAQLADYLYAPTDYILIDRLLDPKEIANYAPAIQIDGALLVLVSGLASVMLPWAAVAHARGDAAVVRKYFVRGTLASLGLLVVASAVTWAMSPLIFKLWLGDTMPATQRILPVLLISTAIGGSSAVGRSILLAVGRVKPFTISVLIAGATNVVCSYVFARFFHWGLLGIVLGTVVAVVGRCGVWMPWYVWRVLSKGGEIGEVDQVRVDVGI